MRATLLMVVALAAGAFLVQRQLNEHRDAAVVAGEVDPDADEVPADALRALAAGVQARDVVMYSTTECVYCGQAKDWLARNGFAFTECNMSVEHRCEDEFRGYGGQGTPFLVVRGRQMREGFDAHQFLRILKATGSRA